MVNDPLFIHFEHENWKPILMEPVKYKETQQKRKKPKRRFKGKWSMLKKTMESNEMITKEDDKKIDNLFQMFEVDKIKYVVKRVIPPGKVRYTFSNKKKLMLARDHFDIEKVSKPIEVVSTWSCHVVHHFLEH